MSMAQDWRVSYQSGKNRPRSAPRAETDDAILRYIALFSSAAQQKKEPQRKMRFSLWFPEFSASCLFKERVG